MDEFGNDSFEDKIRAFAREIGQSIERAAEQVDLDELAERFGVSAASVRQFAEFAGEWLGERLSESISTFNEDVFADQGDQDVPHAPPGAAAPAAEREDPVPPRRP